VWEKSGDFTPDKHLALPCKQCQEEYFSGKGMPGEHEDTIGSQLFSIPAQKNLKQTVI
jgi:hypothetical protein